MLKRFKVLINFLIIINFAVLLTMVALSNLTYAQDTQELHTQTLDDLSKHKPPSEAAHITVGGRPVAIGVAPGRVYVVDSGDEAVSVINAKNNTRIGKDIKVGNEPAAIAVAPGKIYVAKLSSNSVSVFNRNGNRIINDIKVGNEPAAIAVAPGKIYVANSGSNTVSVIDETNNTKIGKDIQVGKYPTAIAVDAGTNTIYVANTDDSTVSVINTTNNTKIGNPIKVINRPAGIAVVPAKAAGSAGRIYVSNTNNNTVSVIDDITNAKIGNPIKVGNGPTAIVVAPGNVSLGNSYNNIVSATGNDSIDTIYVANTNNNTISVISAKNNTKIGNYTKVGVNPVAIGVDALTHTIYVVNRGENTVSVIDEKTNMVVAGTVFNVNPINAGRIECDENRSIAPVAQQFYLTSGSQCVTKPNHGFEFISWQENLKGNATQLIKIASPSSFFDSVLDFLHIMPDKPESKLNITKFGSFTANFKALPPAIPAEYSATLFGVIVAAIVGAWFIPAFIGRISSRIQGGKLVHYIQEVKDLDTKGELDKNGIAEINKLEDKIADEYSKGKLTKDQYDILGNEISISYNEFFSRKIRSLKSNPYEMDKVERLVEINYSIEGIHTTGNLRDQHYANLKNEISTLCEEIFRERMKSLDKLPEQDKVNLAKLVKKIKDEISQARSIGIINDLHFSLLDEKLSHPFCLH